MASFQKISYSQIEPNLSCPICRDDFSENPIEIIYHEGANGLLHPFHRSCITKWIKINPTQSTCPLCKTPVTLNEPQTLREKALKITQRVAITGGLIAAADGVCSVISSLGVGFCLKVGAGYLGGLFLGKEIFVTRPPLAPAEGISPLIRILHKIEPTLLNLAVGLGEASLIKDSVKSGILKTALSITAIATGFYKGLL
jgi:hypothetical protein